MTKFSWVGYSGQALIILFPLTQISPIIFFKYLFFFFLKNISFEVNKALTDFRQLRNTHTKPNLILTYEYFFFVSIVVDEGPSDQHMIKDGIN